MRKKNYKGRTEKRVSAKSRVVCRLYDPIQEAYLEQLEADETVAEVFCNYSMEGLSMGEYTSDFLCKKTDGDLMVRECVQRKFLAKPMTIQLLDASRDYWLRRGVEDWGMVIDEYK